MNDIFSIASSSWRAGLNLSQRAAVKLEDALQGFVDRKGHCAPVIGATFLPRGGEQVR
jgi:hypothetical protein